MATLEGTNGKIVKAFKLKPTLEEIKAFFPGFTGGITTKDDAAVFLNSGVYPLDPGETYTIVVPGFEDDREFKQLKRKLEEQAEQLREQKKAMTEYEATLSAIQEDLVRKSLRAYQSFSHEYVYSRLVSKNPPKLDPTVVLDPFPLVSQNSLQLMWDSFWNTFDYDTEFPSVNDDENVYQGVVEALFTHLQLSIEHRSVKIWKKARLFDPEEVPDLSITSKYDATLSWGNLLVPIEVETVGKLKEGVGKVISYNTRAIERASRNSGYCIYTDCHVIDIFYTKVSKTEEPIKFFHTGPLPFLTKDEEPTAGFKCLVRLLQASPEQLGTTVSHPIGKTISVSYKQLCIQEFLGSGFTSSVYSASSIDSPNKLIALKIENPPNIYLPSERFMLSKVQGQEGIPEILPFSTDKILAIKPCGTSIISLLSTGQLTLRKIYRYGRQIVDILKKVHEKLVCHRDIRPHKIIVHNTKPFLIDWGFATADTGDCEAAVKGTISFMATRILCAMLKSESYYYTPRDDMESLAYTLYYLIHHCLPWQKTESLESLWTLRRDFQAEKQNGTDPIDIFYQRVMDIKPAKPNKRNKSKYTVPYEELRDLLRLPEELRNCEVFFV